MLNFNGAAFIYLFIVCSIGGWFLGRLWATRPDDEEEEQFHICRYCQGSGIE